MTALQKLKVTDLKELLAKNGLSQSGKKDELIQRLVDAGVTGEEGPAEALVDVPDAAPATSPVPATAPPAPAATDADAVPTAAVPAVPAPAAEATPATAPAADSTEANTDEPAAEPEIELTEEQKKQKARAERFGMPWNPPKPKTKVAPAADTAASAAPPAADKNKREKPAAIDKSVSLGISEEVLARRAAKFGLPDKKPAAAATAAAPVTVAAAAPEPAKKAELTPEQVAQLALEEEKKRKRAEKFGVSVAAAEPVNGDEVPDAKKAKV